MSISDDSASVNGLHHVTAIAGDPHQNVSFYTGVMGLRLVKKSVNQDDPGTYHLFYADGAGSPGTDLTFFPWPDMRRRKHGVGHAVEVSFAIPSGSLGYWKNRLAEKDVDYSEPSDRFGEKTITFEDPDGLPLAVVEIDKERDFVPWEHSPVPVEHQLRGMHAVRQFVRDTGPTRTLLTQILGFEEGASENGWTRYHVDGGASGQLLDLREWSEGGEGWWGAGGIHHVAWGVDSDDIQSSLRKKVRQAGLQPSEQIDRFWFRSVYFREPGGTLYELATMDPGFTRDEDIEHLGEELILPPWMENRREQIEAALPELEVEKTGR